MSRTANLRRQHDAAVDLVQQNSAAGSHLGQASVPFKVSMLLTKLRGLLRIDFAQEDNVSVHGTGDPPWRSGNGAPLHSRNGQPFAGFRRLCCALNRIGSYQG